jgi:DNA-binding CsgD family transcriptional regulator/PAS domain-containing protein
MNEARIGTLIENIYASAFEEDGLDGVLQTLRTEFHAAQASLQVREWSEGKHLFIASTLDASCLKPYNAHFYRLDPSGPVASSTKMPSLGQGQIYTEEAFTDRAAWFRSEFYNDFLRQTCDMGQPLISILYASESELGDFLVHRPPSGEEYSDGDRNLMRLLAPHLNRGLQIYRELAGLRGKAGLFEAAFGALGAVFLLDHYGRVLRRNKAAESMLDSGGPLTVCEGRLTARHPPDDDRLAAALKPLQLGVAPPELILRGPASSLRLTVTPVDGLNVPVFFDVTYTARVAFLVTATALGPSLQNLMALYGLTRAEAEVALLLSEGLRPPQIAAQRETSTATVNTQLKQIYAKTGVDGQIALILKLLGRR